MALDSLDRQRSVSRNDAAKQLNCLLSALFARLVYQTKPQWPNPSLVARFVWNMRQFLGQTEEEMNTNGREAVQARYKRAGELLRSERYPQALEDYVWLWESIPAHDPSMRGVRGSFMAKEMRKLLDSYPPSKERFEVLRAEAEKSADRNDWIVLNKILEDDERTLAWFDEQKQQPEAAKTFEHGSFRLQALLIEKDRWADIANYLFTDPVKELNEQYEHSQMLKQFESLRPKKDLPDYDPFRKSAAILYASLLAAGKSEKAYEVAKKSIKLSDTLDLRIELLIYARRAGQFKPELLKWINEAKPSNAVDVVFYQKRMAMYYAFRQREQALKDCDRLIQMDGSAVDYRIVRANILSASNKTQQALDEINRAIERNPASALALSTRCAVQCKLGDIEAASGDIEQATRIDSNLAACHIARSILLCHKKQFKEAHEAATKAIELDPASPAGFGRRGLAAYKLGRFEEALDDLTKWTHEVDDGGEAYYYRSLVYNHLGKPDSAAADRNMSEELGFTPPAERH